MRPFEATPLGALRGRLGFHLSRAELGLTKQGRQDTSGEQVQLGSRDPLSSLGLGLGLYLQSSLVGSAQLLRNFIPVKHAETTGFAWMSFQFTPAFLTLPPARRPMNQ